jgi:hypothetical protein
MDFFSKGYAKAEDKDEEQKKKKKGLVEALKQKYGTDSKGRVTEIIKTRGVSGLPTREIKK